MSLASIVDVVLGGSGRKYQRREDYNPYRDKAAVDPQPDPIPAPPATRLQADPQMDPDNPFNDNPSPVEGDVQPSPATQSPAGATTSDQATGDNPYRRRAVATTTKAPAEDETQDIETEQVFKGYAIRFHRRRSSTFGGPEVFYDLLDVQEQYSRERPDRSEDEVMRQIWQDLESGLLVARPVALDFNGKAVDFLSPDHPVAKTLQSLYNYSVGISDEAPQDSATATTQPEPQTTSTPPAEPAPPVNPDPEPPASAASTEPQPPAEVPAAVEAPQDLPTTEPASTGSTPAPEATPQPTAAPQSSTIDLKSLLDALPASERSQFYAHLAQAVVSSGGLNTQDLATILSAGAQPRIVTSESDLPKGFEQIAAPVIS